MGNPRQEPGGQLLKGGYTAQNSRELELPSRSSPPFYAKQRTVSTEGEKMDMKFDYAQLPAGPRALADLQNSLPQPFKR